MYAFSMNDGDVMCPDCKRVMVDLAGYDRTQDVAGINDGAIPYNPALGMTGGAEVWLAFDFITAIFAFFEERIRRAKIRRLVRTVLPEFPAALVCPMCMFLLRRKVKNEHPHAILQRDLKW